jgi:type I restriction enzyme S subunit
MTNTNNKMITRYSVTRKGFKHTALGWIPEDWDVQYFEDVAEIDKECLPNNTPNNYKFKYISLSDIDSEIIENKTTQQVFETAPSRARRIVKEGNILMSTVRPNLLGFTIIKEDIKDLIASTGFAVISTVRCHNEYLYHFLFTSILQKQFYQLIVGSNYPAINSSDVKKLKILLPPFSEQKAIAALLSTWDKAITNCQLLIDNCQLRKKWLMQQLLTGKKRLQGFNGKWETKKIS